MNVLDLAFDVSRPNYPVVSIVVDGLETLDDGDHDAHHSPESLLDTGALLPRPVPHRVALYGCCCGEFGCSTLTALVSRDDGTVVWTDLAEVGGAVFDSALPYGDHPDPLADPEMADEPFGRGWGPDLVFDADAYLSTVRAAAADRWWETRPRAVARLAMTLRPWGDGPGQVLVSGPDDVDTVAVNFRAEGTWHTWSVAIPVGEPDEAAARLVAQLASRDPRELPGARQLW